MAIPPTNSFQKPGTWGPAHSGQGLVSFNVEMIGKPLMDELGKILEQLNTSFPQELATALSMEMGKIMQENIDSGGNPPWVKSWRERFGQGKTLKDTNEMYDKLPYETPFLEGNGFSRPVSTRLNKDGQPVANTLIEGGYIFPRNTHYHTGGKFFYGLAFPKSEGPGRIFLKPGQPVYIPPRNFAKIDEAGQKRLNNLIEDWIETKKEQIGFTIVDRSHTP